MSSGMSLLVFAACLISGLVTEDANAQCNGHDNCAQCVASRARSAAEARAAAERQRAEERAEQRRQQAEAAEVARITELARQEAETTQRVQGIVDAFMSSYTGKLSDDDFVAGPMEQAKTDWQQGVEPFSEAYYRSFSWNDPYRDELEKQRVEARVRLAETFRKASQIPLVEEGSPLRTAGTEIVTDRETGQQTLVYIELPEPGVATGASANDILNALNSGSNANADVLDILSSQLAGANSEASGPPSTTLSKTKIEELYKSQSELNRAREDRDRRLLDLIDAMNEPKSTGATLDAESQSDQ